MRLFFVAAEVAIFAAGLYLLLSQLVIPLAKGRSLFPAFRKADSTLTSKEVEAATDLDRSLRQSKLPKEES